MIYVDNRAGSRDLYPLLVARGLPATLTRMDYGDICFLGQGPGGEPVSVGIECKTVRDVIQCVCDGRFAGHQLPGLVQSYEQVWLLVEGLWRPNPKSGMLEYRKKRGEWAELTAGNRRFMYRDLVSWFFTAEIKGGIRSVRVGNWGEGSVWLSSLYRWWTNGNGWEDHKSHLAFHDGTRHGTPYKRERATRMIASLSDRALLERPTLTRMIAAQLPNVGWTRSAPLAKKFRTVEELVAASPEELMVDGIGPKIAAGIWGSLRSVK
jgi:ERCC4-type nuclease